MYITVVLGCHWQWGVGAKKLALLAVGVGAKKLARITLAVSGASLPLAVSKNSSEETPNPRTDSQKTVLRHGQMGP